MINITQPSLPPLEEYQKYLQKIWQTKWLTNFGPLHMDLQKKLKKFLKVKNFSLVSNGTLALQIAIKALDLKGEVITTPFTFSASTNVIVWENLKPVFADIDPETYNLDPKEVEKKITKNTSAILAVHVYGNPCAVDALQKIADKNNLKIIYDAAHAFGVKCGRKSVLNYGDISTLSFHATKVYHTIEGGALVCRNSALEKRIRLLSDFGIKDEEKVIYPGINAKMNEFQASMGLCNLSLVRRSIQKRKILYNYYKNGLKNVKFQKINTDQYNYSYMPICLKSLKMRDFLFRKLFANHIKARKYFFPLTIDFSYFSSQERKVKKTLKNAIGLSNRILCLPLYENLKINTVKKIIYIVNKHTA